jgi:hypothetical protein
LRAGLICTQNASKFRNTGFQLPGECFPARMHLRTCCCPRCSWAVTAARIISASAAIPLPDRCVPPPGRTRPGMDALRCHPPRGGHCPRRRQR